MRMAVILCLLAIILVSTLHAQHASWTPLVFPDAPNRPALKVLFDEHGNLWALIFKSFTADAQGRLVYSYFVGRYDGEHWTSYAPGKEMPFRTDSTELRDMLSDRDGNIWVAGDRMLNRYDGVSWKEFHLDDSLAAYRSYERIACDSLGNLWIASRSFRPISRQGSVTTGEQFIEVHRFDGSRWTTLLHSAGISEHFSFGISSLAISPSGHVWITSFQRSASAGGGLYRLENDQWVPFNVPAADTTSTTHALSPNIAMCDPGGDVWLGYGQSMVDGRSYLSGGIARFTMQQEHWERFPFYLLPPDSLHRGVLQSVSALLMDERNVVWSGGNYGLAQYDGVSWQAFRPSESIPGTFADNIFSLAVDSHNDLWLGTGQGIIRFRELPSAVAVDINRTGTTLSILPNIVTRGQMVSVALSGHSAGDPEVRVADPLGRDIPVQTTVTRGGGDLYRVHIRTDHLAAGMYYLHTPGNASSACFLVR